MNSLHFILKENVLNDNILEVPLKGYIFKNGYIAILKEYIYQNAWSDKETIKRFRTEKSLFNYLDKNYKDCEYLNDLDFSETCTN